MISTKGRYAIRIMLDLAEHHTGEYIPMKEVAERQGISLKYIDRIMPDLKPTGFIETTHGRGGGYRLLKDPSDITVWDVLRYTEGDLAPVACLRGDATPCEKAAECRTIGMWTEYFDLIKNFFSSKTLADLMAEEQPDSYII